jgi:hypothetical protein
LISFQNKSAVDFGGRTADVLAIGKPCCQAFGAPYGFPQDPHHFVDISSERARKKIKTCIAPLSLHLQRCMHLPTSAAACLCMICYPHTARGPGPARCIYQRAAAASPLSSASASATTRHPRRLVRSDGQIKRVSRRYNARRPAFPSMAAQHPPPRARLLVRTRPLSFVSPACTPFTRFPLGGRLGCVYHCEHYSILMRTSSFIACSAVPTYRITE